MNHRRTSSRGTLPTWMEQGASSKSEAPVKEPQLQLIPTKLPPLTWTPFTLSREAFIDRVFELRQLVVAIEREEDAEAVEAKKVDDEGTMKLEKTDEEKAEGEKSKAERCRKKGLYLRMELLCKEVVAKIESRGPILQDPVWAEYVRKLADSHRNLKNGREKVWEARGKVLDEKMDRHISSCQGYVAACRKANVWVLLDKPEVLAKELVDAEQEKSTEEVDDEKRQDEEGQRLGEVVTVDEEQIEDKPQGAVRVSVDEIKEVKC